MQSEFSINQLNDTQVVPYDIQFIRFLIKSSAGHFSPFPIPIFLNKKRPLSRSFFMLVIQLSPCAF